MGAKYEPRRMTELTRVQLEPPYLILIGDVADPTYAKTGFGIVHWRPDLVAGQLRFAGCEIDLGVPDMTIPEAVESGVKSLVIGLRLSVELCRMTGGN